jgi:serine/threonine protein kinase
MSHEPVMKPIDQALPPHTCVDRYRIEGTLGGGGFGIVYLARDRANGTRVIIKEYMPGKLAHREANHQVRPSGEAEARRFNHGRTLFLQEASALAKLKHPNIVHVVNFFRANGTVYMAMEFQAGSNLQLYIRRRGGFLSARFLQTVFPPLLDGLRIIHGSDLLHLDIKPSNVHIRPGGQPLLLDFGAVHGFPKSRQDQLGQVISPGFSPIEQYESNGYVGPWSDIYAIGATMRACIEGHPPPSARERYERDTMRSATAAFRKLYPESLLRAIDWAMEVDPTLRPQRVDELLAALTKPTADDQSGSSTPLEMLVGSLPWGKG